MKSARCSICNQYCFATDEGKHCSHIFSIFEDGLAGPGTVHNRDYVKEQFMVFLDLMGEQFAWQLEHAMRLGHFAVHFEQSPIIVESKILSFSFMNQDYDGMLMTNLDDTTDSDIDEWSTALSWLNALDAKGTVEANMQTAEWAKDWTEGRRD